MDKGGPVSDPTREDVETAIINVTSNAMNYPKPSDVLGRSTSHLRGKIADAVLHFYRPILQAARAEAWDEGYSEGHSDGTMADRSDYAFHDNYNGDRNPHRKGTDV